MTNRVDSRISPAVTVVRIGVISDIGNTMNGHQLIIILNWINSWDKNEMHNTMNNSTHSDLSMGEEIIIK